MDALHHRPPAREGVLRPHLRPPQAPQHADGLAAVAGRVPRQAAAQERRAGHAQVRPRQGASHLEGERG